MDAASKTDLADVWRERITSQQSAGDSIREWCKANSCHEHAFYWWRARLGLSPVSGSKRRRRVAQPMFAEVVVAPSRVGLMTLRLRGGAELTLPVISVPQIAELVRAIEGGK